MELYRISITEDLTGFKGARCCAPAFIWLVLCLDSSISTSNGPNNSLCCKLVYIVII